MARRLHSSSLLPPNVCGGRQRGAKVDALRHAHTSHWLVAAATHRSLGISYEEACQTLCDVPQSMLDEFELELEAQGQQVVLSTPRLTVLDTEESGDSGNSWLRSLHFNEKLDFVQSCVRVRGDKDCDPIARIPDHSAPPPSQGSTATHLKILLAAVGLHQVISQLERTAVYDVHRPMRLAILGAGGCSVPAHLVTALQLPGAKPAEIHAVEVDTEVVATARECFGIGALEKVAQHPGSATDVRDTDANHAPVNTLQLHTQCAFAWIKAATEPIDVLIVDLHGGDDEVNRLRARERAVYAPPAAATGAEFLHDVTKVVGRVRCGVVAFNVIATPAGLVEVQEKIRQAFSIAQHPRCDAMANHDTCCEKPEFTAGPMWTVELPDDFGDNTVDMDANDASHNTLHRLLLVRLGGQSHDLSGPSATDSELGRAISGTMDAVGLKSDEWSALMLQRC